jgi:hypothetical protein
VCGMHAHSACCTCGVCAEAGRCAQGLAHPTALPTAATNSPARTPKPHTHLSSACIIASSLCTPHSSSSSTMSRRLLAVAYSPAQ